MDSRLSPAQLFYPLALIVLTGLYFFPSPLLPLVFFYCILTGAIWNYLPGQLQIENPQVKEMAPPLFLLLFMAVLTQALGRPTTETLFHTVRGLILFRTLTFILLKIRVSPNPIRRPLLILIAGIVLEMIFVGIRVYHLIYPLEPMPDYLPYVETKVLALLVAGLTLHAFFQARRS
jgi:cellulose synthase/poly-beta-1,6-N-acetylglucosamine synthase-like glycosyltransferase